MLAAAPPLDRTSAVARGGTGSNEANRVPRRSAVSCCRRRLVTLHVQMNVWYVDDLQVPGSGPILMLDGIAYASLRSLSAAPSSASSIRSATGRRNGDSDWVSSA